MKSFFTIPLLLFLSHSALSLSQHCNKNDQKVLYEIKKSLGSPNHFSSWNKEFDCCKWYGVHCDKNTSHVISLVIQYANISGQIPNAVGDLPFLQSLIIAKISNLTGPIPSAITKLPRLTMLWLSWTNISGPVPAFLSQLKNLEYLNLRFNDLSGSIPPELASLTKLGALFLDRNKITGVIPESFGSFKGPVTILILSHNQLTGTVPKSLGNMNFEVIDFSRNQLSGDISMFFGPNKTIHSAFFSRNNFTFNLSEVVFPASLADLDLNHNKIFGSLPEALTGLSLQHLNVSYNRLCGQIPQGGYMQKFESTEYFHNRCLCGSPLSACT